MTYRRSLLAGVGVGAGLIYLLDPDRGARDMLVERVRANSAALCRIHMRFGSPVPREPGEAADVHVIEAPERLLREEEPEAFDQQHFDGAESETLAPPGGDRED